MQLPWSGFDSRHRHVAGKWSFEEGWFFGPANVTSRHWECRHIRPIGANNVYFLAQLWENSTILGNGVCFTANLGELAELWPSAHLEESAQLCV